jgi:hypothetical protein
VTRAGRAEDGDPGSHHERAGPDAAAPGPSRTAWGYVLPALAAACIGFDRFFGISSGWMRSMTTAQALERRLEQLQHDWAAECARTSAGRQGDGCRAPAGEGSPAQPATPAGR